TLALISECFSPPLIDGRPLVSFYLSLIAASFRVELHPIGRGRSPDKIEFVVVQMKENGIANDVAVVVAGNKLLGLIDLESLEAVYTQIRKQLECNRTLDVKISHMVRLIEKSTGVPPRTLFISPVRELGAHYWKGIRT